MKEWLDKFLSEFHKSRLKNLGYKKSRRTFSRDMGNYWERFNFQGSMSNGLNEDWRFYINIGIEFKELTPRKYYSYFANTHWANRIESVVKTASGIWYYNSTTNQKDLMSQLVPLFDLVSKELSSESNLIRISYTEKKGKYVQ